MRVKTSCQSHWRGRLNGASFQHAHQIKSMLKGALYSGLHAQSPWTSLSEGDWWRSCQYDNQLACCCCHSLYCLPRHAVEYPLCQALTAHSTMHQSSVMSQRGELQQAKCKSPTTTPCTQQQTPSIDTTFLAMKANNKLPLICSQPTRHLQHAPYSTSQHTAAAYQNARLNVMYNDHPNCWLDRLMLSHGSK